MSFFPSSNVGSESDSILEGRLQNPILPPLSPTAINVSKQTKKYQNFFTLRMERHTVDPLGNNLVRTTKRDMGSPFRNIDNYESAQICNITILRVCDGVFF